jgi:hypothetical protein
MKAQAQPNANTDTNMNANINPLQQTLPPSSINNNDMQAVELDGSYLVIRVSHQRATVTKANVRCLLIIHFRKWKMITLAYSVR